VTSSGHRRAQAGQGRRPGKQGKVIEVFPETSRVIVEGVNRVTKHTKAGARTRAGRATGGIITPRRRST
jgi:large subunit ribosomal protein L24